MIIKHPQQVYGSVHHLSARSSFVTLSSTAADSFEGSVQRWPVPQIIVTCDGETTAWGRQTVASLGYEGTINAAFDCFIADAHAESDSTETERAAFVRTARLYPSFHRTHGDGDQGIVALHPRCVGWEELISNITALKVVYTPPNAPQSAASPAEPPARTASEFSRYMHDISEATVARNVKALLLELEGAECDSIADEIIAWARVARDGRTLEQVVELVYDRALEDRLHAESCANLCRKMAGTIALDQRPPPSSSSPHLCGTNVVWEILLPRFRRDFARLWARDASPSSSTQESTGLAIATFLGMLLKHGIATECTVDEWIESMSADASRKAEQIECLHTLISARVAPAPAPPGLQRSPKSPRRRAPPSIRRLAREERRAQPASETWGATSPPAVETRLTWGAPSSWGASSPPAVETRSTPSPPAVETRSTWGAPVAAPPVVETKTRSAWGAPSSWGASSPPPAETRSTGAPPPPALETKTRSTWGAPVAWPLSPPAPRRVRSHPQAASSASREPAPDGPGLSLWAAEYLTGERWYLGDEDGDGEGDEQDEQVCRLSA